MMENEKYEELCADLYEELAKAKYRAEASEAKLAALEKLKWYCGEGDDDDEGTHDLDCIVPDPGDVREVDVLTILRTQWAAHVVVREDEWGDAAETECRLFDSFEEAKAAAGKWYEEQT